MKIIHLEECEPERHPDWKVVEYWTVYSDGSGELCPQTEYMREDLFPDEKVWIEER